MAITASWVRATRQPGDQRSGVVPLDGPPPERLLAEDRILHVAPVGVSDSYFGDVSADGRTVAYAIEDETHPPDFWVTDPTFRAAAPDLPISIPTWTRSHWVKRGLSPGRLPLENKRAEPCSYRRTIVMASAYR